MSNFRDVGIFHQRFGLHNVHLLGGAGPVEITPDLLEFRIGFMQEELQEFIDASETMDHAGMADALIDLVYVALGTAHLFGYPWETLWNEVQRANMTKVRAPDAESSKRNSEFDVIKPDGWTPPDIQGILERFGWETP